MADLASSHTSFLVELDGFLRTNALDLDLKLDESVELELTPETLLLSSDEVSAKSGEDTDSSPDPNPAEQTYSGTRPKRVCTRGRRKKRDLDFDSFRAKETKRRQAYRQRMKQERDSLQAQVVELTQQLDELIHRLVKNTNGTKLASSVSTWKALARCQREARVHALQEQKQLVASVSSQTSLIEDFRAMFLNRLEIAPAINEILLGGRSMEIHKDSVLFDTYISELRANYARTEAVLGADALTSTNAGIKLSTFKDSFDGSIKYFQYRGAKTSPLQFKRACQNYWRLAHIQHRDQDRSVYASSKDLHNIFAVRFRASVVTMTGSIVSLVQRLVVRRFVENHHFVLVWRIFIEGEGVYSGMNANDSGWCRLRPISSEIETGTIMDICVHQEPMQFSSKSNEHQVHEFHDAVIKVSRENEEKLHKGMEMPTLGRVNRGPTINSME